jgi:hypothetical protein
MRLDSQNIGLIVAMVSFILLLIGAFNLFKEFGDPSRIKKLGNEKDLQKSSSKSGSKVRHKAAI